MTSQEQWYCRGIGLASGLLLTAGNVFWQMAPLQAVAFVPVLYAVIKGGIGKKIIFGIGLYMGLGYTLTQVFVLRLPVLITLVLLVDLTVTIMLSVSIGGILSRRSPLAGAIAFGATLAVMDWVNYTAVPMWGTAQAIGRCWSYYPNLIWFSSLTGITGMLFFVGVFQVLVVNVMIRRGRIRSLVGIVGLVVLVFGGMMVNLRSGVASGRLKVAAVGWVSEAGGELYDIDDEDLFDGLYSELVAKAAGQGARVVVAPELAFEFGQNHREEWVERFSALAKKHNVWLIAGYYNNTAQENRMLFVTDGGLVKAEYTKTHLTPFEGFIKGTGKLREVRIDDVTVGGMVCQDDNFTDLSRRYGQGGVDVVAVPTLDWRPVRYAHLQNSVHRAIESRYAVVRATLNGISAVVAADGELIASCDHYKEGADVVVGEVEVFDGVTVFSRFGNWFVLWCVGFLVAYIVTGYSYASVCSKQIAGVLSRKPDIIVSAADSTGRKLL